MHGGRSISVENYLKHETYETNGNLYYTRSDGEHAARDRSKSRVKATRKAKVNQITRVITTLISREE